MAEPLRSMTPSPGSPEKLLLLPSPSTAEMMGLTGPFQAELSTQEALQNSRSFFVACSDVPPLECSTCTT